MSEPKLYAILHDGTLEGDNLFYVSPESAIPYEEGITLKQLADKALEKEIIFEEEDKQYVAGAWIVDEKTLDAIEAVWQGLEGGDRETYTTNRSAKNIAAKLAVKTLGKRAK